MNNLKKILVLVLAAAMLLSLAACGKGTDKPESTPTPDTVYASEFYTFPDSGEDLGNLDVRYVDEDGFLVASYAKVGEREPEEGEVVEYEGQLDIYEQRLYRMDFSGKLTPLAYEPLKLEGGHGDGQSSWINGLVRTDAGFITVEELYVSWNNAPAGVEPYSDEWYMYYESEDHYYIRSFDAEGRELSSVEIDLTEVYSDDGYINPYRIAQLEDGSLLMTGESALYAFDPADGSFRYKVETDFDWIMSMLQLPDGQIYVLGYGDGPKGWSSMLKPFDAKKRSLGKSLTIDGDLYDAVPGSGKYLLYYTNGTNFYGYDAEKKESVKLFNWLNVDVLSDDLTSYSVLADGSIVGLMAEWDRNHESATYTMVTIREVPASAVAQKTTLTLATAALDWNMRRQIVRFNRASETTRIEVLDYSEYTDYENDYDENGYGEAGGLKKLRTEILAGNMPDILDLGSMPVHQLAAKGLLIDLYPLLDADPGLSREDIFPNVLKALENDGKLTSLSSGFYIWTCVGAKAVVGDTPGWTYKQLNDALATMPEGCTVFGVGTTRDSVLQTMLQLDMGQFVDWDTGKVSFDSQAFVDLLNFVKGFPADFDWENYEWTDDDNEYTRVRQGKQLLVSYAVSGMSDLIQCEALFGGPDSYTVIGYPTAEGVGSLLLVDSGYGISRDCKDPEAAWQFLRILLTEDYQENNEYNFPTNRKVFEKQKQAAMTPTYVRDEKGNILLDPETGERRMEEKGWVYDPVTWESTPIYSYTAEQVATVEELVLSTYRVPDNNQAILDIVREQAQAFFAGQRTAEEVAKLIQSKVNIYVNEQR